jgi:hypothetical protein
MDIVELEPHPVSHVPIEPEGKITLFPSANSPVVQVYIGVAKKDLPSSPLAPKGVKRENGSCFEKCPATFTITPMLSGEEIAGIEIIPPKLQILIAVYKGVEILSLKRQGAQHNSPFWVKGIHGVVEELARVCQPVFC